MCFVSENNTVHYGYEVGKGEMGVTIGETQFLWMHVPSHPIHTLALKGNLFFSQESLFTVLGDYNWMCEKKLFCCICGLRESCIKSKKLFQVILLRTDKLGMKNTS